MRYTHKVFQYQAFFPSPYPFSQKPIAKEVRRDAYKIWQYQTVFNPPFVEEAPAEDVTIDKWYRQIDEPIRKKSIQYLFTQNFIPPTDTTIDKWFQQYENPIIKKKIEYLFENYFSDDLQPIPNISSYLPNYPDIIKKLRDLIYTYPSIFYEYKDPIPVEVLQMDTVSILSHISKNRKWLQDEKNPMNVIGIDVVKPPIFIKLKYASIPRRRPRMR